MQVLHQTVSLRVDTSSGLWSGHTELRVSLPAGAAALALHAFNLTVHSAEVDGAPAAHALREYPQPALAEPTLAALARGGEPLRTVADEAYASYLRQMQLEQAPELTVQLPDAVLRAKAAAAEEEAQKQQQQVEAAQKVKAEKGGEDGKTPDKGKEDDKQQQQKVKEEPKEGSQQQQQKQTPPPPERATAEGKTPPPVAAGGATTSAGTPGGAAAAAAATPTTDRRTTPAAADAAAAAAATGPASEHTVVIRFSKPARDAAALAAGGFLVVAPPLRRMRAVFPCIDGPVYYEPGLPHVAPYPLELVLTVGPREVAVAGGELLRQTAVKTRQQQQELNGDDGGGGGSGSNKDKGGSDGSGVVARVFHYAFRVPILPQHAIFAVGPFDVMPAAAIFGGGATGRGGGGAAGASSVAAAIAGPPVVTAFYPGSAASAAARAAAAQDQQERLNNGCGGAGSAAGAAALAALSLAGGGGVGSCGIGGSSSSGSGGAMLAAPAVAAALRPLAIILRQCERLVGVRAPFERLQVAIVPAEAAAAPVSVGAGAIFLSSDLVPPEGSLEGGIEAAAALANAVARLFFGVLLLPPAAEDAWLPEGLAEWLAAGALRALLGANEVAYRRWSERGALAAVDDGAQLAPLSETLPAGGGGGGAGGAAAAAGAGAAGYKYDGPAVNRDTAAGWGLTYGAGALEPWAARRWKAAAVAAMAERRIGDGDEFRRMLERVVLEAAAAPGDDGSGGGSGAQEVARARLQLSTAWFLKNVRRKAEGSGAAAKEDASAFRARWVAGAGMPSLRGAFAWDARAGVLLLALRQRGGVQCLKAALRSRARAEGLKVLVRELGGEAEHALSLGVDEALALRRLEVSLERHAIKRGPGRRPKEPRDPSTLPGANPDAAEALGIPESELAGVAALWVRLDPNHEWLADARVAQPFACWRWQLQHSKDAVSQAEAVAGLAALVPAHEGVVDALEAALRRTSLFCRVRADAALALGATASDATYMRGAHALVAYWREQCCDGASGAWKPNNFSDPAEYVVLRAVPAALALVRNAAGHTPEFVLQALLEALRDNDNSHNAADDSDWLAGLVSALGGCRPAGARQLARALAEIDRQLAHEAVVGTRNRVLGCACLRAVAELATRVVPPPALGAIALAPDSDPTAVIAAAAAASARQLLGDARRLLWRYVGPAAPAPMRDAARECLMTVAAYEALHAPLPPPLPLPLAPPQQPEAAQPKQEPAANDGPAPMQEDAPPPVEQQQQQQPDAAAPAAPGQGEGDAQMQEVAPPPQPPQQQQQPPPVPPMPPPAPMPVDAALRAALALLAREPPGAGRAAVLKAALLSIARLEADLGLDLAGLGAKPGAAAASPAVVARLHALLACHGDPRLRHLAFMLLQRAAGQPATLYREREDEGDAALLAAGAERSVSAQTAAGGGAGGTQAPARSGMPAASGPSGGRSHADGGAPTATNAPRPMRVRLGVRLPPSGATATATTTLSREPGSASKEAAGPAGSQQTQTAASPFSPPAAAAGAAFPAPQPAASAEPPAPFHPPAPQLPPPVLAPPVPAPAPARPPVDFAAPAAAAAAAPARSASPAAAAAAPAAAQPPVRKLLLGKKLSRTPPPAAGGGSAAEPPHQQQLAAPMAAPAPHAPAPLAPPRSASLSLKRTHDGAGDGEPSAKRLAAAGDAGAAAVKPRLSLKGLPLGRLGSGVSGAAGSVETAPSTSSLGGQQARPRLTLKPLTKGGGGGGGKEEGGDGSGGGGGGSGRKLNLKTSK